MAVVVVRVRWESATPEDEALLRGVLRPGSWLADGCRVRRLDRHGPALTLVEVWGDGAAAERGLAVLCRRLRAAGLPWPGATVADLPADGWGRI